MALSADGRLAVSASDDKILKIWNPRHTRELRALKGHSARVNGVAMSADGQLAVSASFDRTLKVWDVASGRELHTLTGHSGPIWRVAVSADGRLAVSASGDKTLKVWDLTAGKQRLTIKWERMSCAISPKGDFILSGAEDGTWVWFPPPQWE